MALSAESDKRIAECIRLLDAIVPKWPKPNVPFGTEQLAMLQPFLATEFDEGDLRNEVERNLGIQRAEVSNSQVIIVFWIAT